MGFTREFTNTEIMAMAGYQLDPGHSDLDNEQPMSVRVHDGLWDHVDLRCTLGDIREAKRRCRGSLERDLVMSLMLGALKALVEEQADYMTINKLGDPEKQHNIKRAREAITKAEALRP